MQFRHELKHEITYQDAEVLKMKLNAVMKKDSHAENGRYEIRSIYFDNVNDRILLEKINGINVREKFRIRYYNGDTSYVLLEKKQKINGLCSKEQTELSTEEIQAVIRGMSEQLAKSEKPLLAELGRKMLSQGIRLKTIVDYTRYAYVCSPGNVRVTLDCRIKTGMWCSDFLNPNCIMVPVPDTQVILEVKWDEFLPSYVRDAIQQRGIRTSAFSKYAACRVYG